MIGNPPYINVERLSPVVKDALFRYYETCSGRTDIYIGFIEKALSILTKRGVMTFIIPFAFTNQNYAELSRLNIVKNHELSEIVDTSDYMVFDNASVKNIILRVRNCPGNDTVIKHASNPDAFINHCFGTRIIATRKFQGLRKCRFETKDFEPLLDLKTKIEANSFLLKKICFVGYGVRVNSKTDKDKPKSYYVSPIKRDGYKPFVEGKNINRYYHSDNGWLNYCPNEHYNPMFPQLFENEKIIFINVVSGQLRFAYDPGYYYNSHTVVNCVRIDKLLKAQHISARRAIAEGDINLAKTYPTKFILGVLNSKIIYWYFSNFMSDGLHIFPEDASNLPIPLCDEKAIKRIEETVDRIISMKNHDPLSDTSNEEKAIEDILASALKLSEEERATIEAYQ